MKGARLATCGCGEPAAAWGRAGVWDPVTNSFRLILWALDEDGMLRQTSVEPVKGCPFCLKPFEANGPDASILPTVDNHLDQLHGPKRVPVPVPREESVVPESDDPFDLFRLPREP